MELKVFSGQQALDSGLAGALLALDRENMLPVLGRAGLPFPVEKRLRGFRSNPTLVVAFEGPAVAGYLEYLRSWNDPAYIYVGSVQIERRHRHGRLLLRLFDEFRRLVVPEDFEGFETNVQKANAPAVCLYRKIGFRLEENPDNEASWVAKAGRELLHDSPLVTLLERWRERPARRASRS